jgi:ParB family chromosome partitioning protein
MAVKKGLGRGVDALITKPEDEYTPEHDSVLQIDINKIEPNINQPRRDFNKNELDELAESIRVYGVLSPLIVTKEAGYYTIVAGERRWRASRLAGLRTLPVIVREFFGRETLEVALIENLQRSDLNPMEEAASFKRLSEEFGLTQENIAERIGKSRSAIANSLRLLNLPDVIREMLSGGRLSAGHAKVLLGVGDAEVQIELADEAADGGLSVRGLEEAVSVALSKKNSSGKNKMPPQQNLNVYSGLEKELTESLMARTKIKSSKDGNKGKIEIGFDTKDELDRLFLVLRNL